MPNISKSRLMTLPIEIPSLALQEEFGERVREANDLAAVQASNSERLDGLYQSLVHRAFNGEL
jgi:type I restriction enzyme S subunit